MERSISQHVMSMSRQRLLLFCIEKKNLLFFAYLKSLWRKKDELFHFHQFIYFQHFFAWSLFHELQKNPFFFRQFFFFHNMVRVTVVVHKKISFFLFLNSFASCSIHSNYALFHEIHKTSTPIPIYPFSCCSIKPQNTGKTMKNNHNSTWSISTMIAHEIFLYFFLLNTMFPLRKKI